MVEEIKQSNQSTKVPSENLAKMVAQAKQLGTDTVPEGTSELETKILAIFNQSGKILTAKQVYKIIGEREQKYYSDKLWYLAQADKLVKLKTRGYYQSVEAFKGTS